MDPTIDPTMDPTIDPTIDPTTEPTVDPTKSTIDPSINPTMEPTKNPTNNSVFWYLQIPGSTIFVVVIVVLCGDIILIFMCLVYIVIKLLPRSKKPGNATYKNTVREFGIMQCIGIVVELFDMITDYLYAASLIVDDDSSFNSLGWISLSFAILGLCIFLIKYSTYRKLIASQVKQLKQELNMCHNDKNDEIVKEIRYRTMDINIISLLNGTIEDVPQTLIVLIATSDIKWNYISISSIAFSMISFTLKLSKVIVTSLGCDDQSIPENKVRKQLEMVHIYHEHANTNSYTN